MSKLWSLHQWWELYNVTHFFPGFLWSVKSWQISISIKSINQYYRFIKAHSSFKFLESISKNLPSLGRYMVKTGWFMVIRLVKHLFSQLLVDAHWLETLMWCHCIHKRLAFVLCFPVWIYTLFNGWKEQSEERMIQIHYGAIFQYESEPAQPFPPFTSRHRTGSQFHSE